MLAFVIQRLLQGVAVMLVVGFIAFSLFNFVGDPVALMLPPEATQADRQAMREALGLDFRPPSGESPRDVQERLRPWLLRLADAGRPTIAVTHKGVVRALYAQARDWPMIGKAPDSLQWDHAHLFSIAATGRAMLERVNIRLIP